MRNLNDYNISVKDMMLNDTTFSIYVAWVEKTVNGNRKDFNLTIYMSQGQTDTWNAYGYECKLALSYYSL